MIFAVLLPVLTASCVVWAIQITLQRNFGPGIGRLMNLGIVFVFLDILVVAQIFYWMRRREPIGSETLKSAGKLTFTGCLFGGCLAELVALAAVIFLFGACQFLARM
jgi:hypothetical protein